MILGTSRGVWDDLVQIRKLTFNPDVMLINYMGYHYPHRANHFASTHADWFEPSFHCHRQGRDHFAPVHFHKPEDYKDKIDLPRAGTSSLFGVLVALHLGYERIILGGIPLDDQGHFYHPPGYVPDWGGTRGYQNDPCIQEWQSRIEGFNDRVRSVSGHTKEWLGEPTREWINH